MIVGYYFNTYSYVYLPCIHTYMFDPLFSLIVPSPTVKVIAIGSQTMGDKLSLRCDVNITKGISSSVILVWKINDTERGEIVKYPLSNTSVMYTNFLNISSLNSTDNNTVYNCQAVINTSLSVNVSDNASLTINIAGKKLCS